MIRTFSPLRGHPRTAADSPADNSPDTLGPSADVASKTYITAEGAEGAQMRVGVYELATIMDWLGGGTAMDSAADRNTKHKPTIMIPHSVRIVKCLSGPVAWTGRPEGQVPWPCQALAVQAARPGVTVLTPECGLGSQQVNPLEPMALEALAGHRTKLVLSDVQPASVFGRDADPSPGSWCLRHRSMVVGTVRDGVTMERAGRGRITFRTPPEIDAPTPTDR